MSFILSIIIGIIVMSIILGITFLFFNFLFFIAKIDERLIPLSIMIITGLLLGIIIYVSLKG